MREDEGHDAAGRDLARGGLRRGAKLMSVPLQAAGRGAVGWGRRVTGADAATVNAELRDASAQQLFSVLGELKGGAMKVGQMMSLMETALPDDVAAPYREQLRKLQAGAPPMPSSRVAAVMSAEFGPGWRSRFSRFNLRPTAAASIGQVHQGVWADTGEPCAVKIQYPGAAEALRSDLTLLGRMSSLVQPLAGGMDLRALAEEVKATVGEETDYEREAAQQEQAARGFDGDPEVLVPHVLAHTGKVIVSQWVDARPFASAEAWPDAERNRLGLAYARFLFRTARTCGLLHGDPHPGNFLLASDGRLAAIDWGLAAAMPELPEQMGRLLRLAARGDAAGMTDGLREEGFVTKNVDVEALHRYLMPFVEPAAEPEFHFNRAWMQGQVTRLHSDDVSLSVLQALNLPPNYLLLYRVWLGGVAVLSQLDCRAPFASILDEYLTGWAAA